MGKFIFNPFHPDEGVDATALATGFFDGRYVNVTGDTMTGDLIGTDYIKTRNVTISRTSGLVSSIAKTGGRTLTITRNATTNGITSIADGTRTWTITRNGNDRMTAIAIA